MIVYKYTNLINGKSYIGITSRDLKTRHKEHLKAIGGSHVFHRALRKYGSKNFKLEIIDTANEYDELLEKEKLHISLANTYIGSENSNGYNMTIGGEGTIGYSHTAETRRLLSEQKKVFYKTNPHPSLGVPVSEETRERMRVLMTGRYKGEKNPYYGKMHPKEVRARLSEKWYERYASGFHNRSGAVLSEETKAKISAKLTGRKISEEQKRAHSELMSGEKHPIARKVLCITTGEVFDYMGEASAKYGLDRSNLTKNCKGRTKWCGVHPETKEKLVWKYYEEKDVVVVK